MHADLPDVSPYFPASHAAQAPASDTPRLVFPYFPAGQGVHWLEFATGENWPTTQPPHDKIWPLCRFVAYPGLHTHCSSVAPGGESEYAGHPAHEPEYGVLYVLAAQSVHPVAPCIEYFPAGHQAHNRYDPAPSAPEYVPFGHSWHACRLVAPAASENRPVPHRTQLEARVRFDQVPAGQAVHAVKLPPE
jgi:hypothetical protein